MIVDLPDLKAHLRVDPGVHDEDAVIESLGAAAERQVSSWIGRPIYARVEDLPVIGDPAYHTAQIVADAAVGVAIKMLVDRMFHHRGGEGDGDADAAPPLTVRALLAEHCRWA